MEYPGTDNVVMRKELSLLLDRQLHEFLNIRGSYISVFPYLISIYVHDLVSLFCQAVPESCQ